MLLIIHGKKILNGCKIGEKSQPGVIGIVLKIQSNMDRMSKVSRESLNMVSLVRYSLEWNRGKPAIDAGFPFVYQVYNSNDAIEF